MKQFIITPVGQVESQKLVRKYLQNHYHPASLKETYGDHIVEQSELRRYVQAAYRNIKVSGPCGAIANEFFKNRMTIKHFFVPSINSLIVQEMLLPDLAKVVHILNFDTGTIHQAELPESNIKGVRPNTSEILALAAHSHEWFLFDLLNGKTRQVCTFGDDFHVSLDGNYFLPMNLSQVGLVDLETGTLLDLKNKRHFCRYATRVQIVTGIHFDPERLCLFILLRKNLELSFSAMKNELCLKLTVSG